MAVELPEVKLMRCGNMPVATKLGGTPEWIQVEWKPECCGKPMVFLGQIDSLDMPEAALPDSALVYVFFCSKCFDVAAQLQCC